MKDIFGGALAAGGLVAGIIVLCCLGTIMGAIGGWLVGLFFGATILNTLASFGVYGVSMWELGATLGFVSGFFRNSITVQKG